MIRKGDVCWIVESNRRKRQVEVLKVDRDFATVAFYEGGGIRVRKNRLFETAAAADQYLKQVMPECSEPPKRRKTQYDYMDYR